ncbi:MAG TPA: hypothetical protein PLB11_07940 [Flavobacterium sp.]|nr:hypothetical protein [Flavobacterium sp.]
MKTLEQILKQEPVYLHNWKEKIDMIGDFEDLYMTSEEYRAEKSPYQNEELWLEKKLKMTEAIKRYEENNILFASYGTDNYSGDAFVLFEKYGKLYEVNGSHCSCYELEGQFKPEETTLESIEMRLTKGTMGFDDYSDNEFATELKSFIGVS